MVKELTPFEYMKQLLYSRGGNCINFTAIEVRKNWEKLTETEKRRFAKLQDDKNKRFVI